MLLQNDANPRLLGLNELATKSDSPLEVLWTKLENVVNHLI